MSKHFTVNLCDPGDAYCYNPGDVVRADDGAVYRIVSLTDRGAVLRPLRWYERLVHRFMCWWRR